MTIRYTLFVILFCLACKQENSKENLHTNDVLDQESSPYDDKDIYEHYQGETMGTFYSVKFDSENSIAQQSIDSLLKNVNYVFSTYIENSIINTVNSSGISSIFDVDDYWQMFFDVYTIAQEINQSSNKYFDPTVKPLVEYWGFGEKKRMRKARHVEIVELLKLVGLEKINIVKSGSQLIVTKDNEKVKLDFNAIAKGYGVDVIANALEQKGIKDYMIEIGGETKTKGVSEKNENWVLGISSPSPNAALNSVALKVKTDNMAMASSGNYRNFYELNGRTYNHTINPISGLAYPSDLLAISVIAKDCVSADAYATACMAMGLKEAKHYIQSLKDVEACFFYGKQDDFNVDYSLNFQQFIVN